MIGLDVDRLDAWSKVSGAAQYAADYRPDGLLHALALRSPVGRGSVRAIDARRALAMHGVAAVFSHCNAGEMGWTWNPEADALGAEVLGRSALNDAPSRLPAYRPLCGSEIFFAGQWIAVVVGETLEIVRAALATIIVEIDSLPIKESPSILPGPFFAGDMQYVRDSRDEAVAVAATVHAVYETPMQLHQPMEPSATTAVWENGRVTLYDSTQGTHAVRGYVARSLGIPSENVRVVAPYVGGGFGAKNQVWPHQALAAHMARKLGRPVCMQLTRADMAVASGYRSQTRQEIELSAAVDGRLRLLRHASDIPTSLRGGFFEPCGLNSLILYKSSRVEVSHRVKRSPVATPTPFRAPGETPGSFALETALDELAFGLKMDPLTLRVHNFAERDFYHDRDWSSNNLLQCYRAGAERFRWPARFVEPRSMRRGGCMIGYGVATTAYPAPALPAAVRVTLDVLSGVVLETSATDIGTGMRTILAQAAAAELQVDLAQIRVELADSDLPEAPTAGRSKSTASVLPAALDACRNVLAELDRVTTSPDAGANLIGPLERLERAGLQRLSAEGRSPGASKSKSLSYYSFGVHFAEVEVDELIGRLRVRRMVSAFDCGRIVNRKLAESQIRGGITFGLGMALFEEARRHPAQMRVLSDNLAEYVIPSHADVPEIDVVFIEQPDTQFNEIGARGLGEIGVPGVAAAIGNAVFNATGRRCRSLPIQASALIA